MRTVTFFDTEIEPNGGKILNIGRIRGAVLIPLGNMRVTRCRKRLLRLPLKIETIRQKDYVAKSAIRNVKSKP